MKEAIVFPTEEEDEIPIWTVARAMDSGWMFRIPVWGRKGNGYIYDSDFISADDAKLEVENYLGHEISVAKNIKFDPGALDKPWINNVCARDIVEFHPFPGGCHFGPVIHEALARLMLKNRLV